MSAPTKKDLRRLVQEMKKNVAQNSPSSSVTEQERVPGLSQDNNLFQDSRDPYQEFSPYN